jgi:DNA-3-methyladenine glycosylase I
VTSTLVGDDGLRRCAWCGSDPLYVQYHDTEWGVPVRDERAIFEQLCLEGFQAGLSWITVLRKRQAFRDAFDDFQIERVASLGRRDVARLMKRADIVRNRAKIDSAIGNAHAAIALAESGRSLTDVFWSHAPTRRTRVPKRLADLAPTTPESVALSTELKRHGFRFVGPTTMYAAMQSLGIVNDHLATCALRDRASTVTGGRRATRSQRGRASRTSG